MHNGSNLKGTSHTGWKVASGLLLFAIVWLSHLALTSLSPPADNIEQLTWVRSLEWGYYKHPPMPTWLIWLPVQLFGLSSETSYITGAACTLGAIGILWRLLAKRRGTTYASVALLAILCITYYNGRLNYYNHNVVLMLLSAASAALCWQAFSTRQLRWWTGLGLTLGLGALSKYQIAVTMISILVFLIQQRAWRDSAHRIGALLACLVALVLFIPHLEWLRTHEFSPIRYAVETSLGVQIDTNQRLVGAMHWFADQVLTRALPALVLLAAVAYSTSKKNLLSSSRGEMGLLPVRDPVKSLLLAWGMVPLVFIPLIGVLFGSDLQLQWGTPFLLFAVPMVMELTPRIIWDQADLGKTLRIFLIIQVLLLTLNQLTSPSGPSSMRNHHWRTFDSKALAEGIAVAARAELGGPIFIVIGSAATAGALALQLPERPQVLIDGRFDRSPWIKPGTVQNCGSVELGSMHTLARGKPVGPAFPDLAWRVNKPVAMTGSCGLESQTH